MIPTGRARIRHYLLELLKSKVDVNNRVYINRMDSPYFIEELPAVNIQIMTETNEVKVGDEYLVKEYLRKLNVVISVAVEDVVEPDEDVDRSELGEDFLDFLTLQIEQAIFDDKFMSRLLPDFDPNTNYHGLVHGNRLLGTEPYEIDTQGDRRVIGADMRWVFPYQTPGYVDRRYDEFLEYKADIVRVGATSETVDSELIEAEGDVR